MIACERVKIGGMLIELVDALMRNYDDDDDDVIAFVSLYDSIRSRKLASD